jgi:hypothetical protein
MRRCLKPVLVIILTVVSTGLYAQFRSGYVFGVNLSSMTYKNKGENVNPEVWPGIHFGGIFELPVGGNFTFQPGILFSAKGSGYEIDSSKYSISPIFIEVPLRAAYYFGRRTVRFMIFAGPYFAIGIDGLFITPEGARNINFGSGYNNDMRSFDLGFNTGVGLNIGGFLISLQYGEGLLNLAPVKSDGSEMKNKVFAISFSSLMEHKK